jgi:hypothetical protein
VVPANGRVVDVERAITNTTGERPMADSAFGDIAKMAGGAVNDGLQNIAPAIQEAMQHFTEQMPGVIPVIPGLTTEVLHTVQDDGIEVIDAIPDDQFDAPLVGHHDDADNVEHDPTDHIVASSAHDSATDDSSATA